MKLRITRANFYRHTILFFFLFNFLYSISYFFFYPPTKGVVSAVCVASKIEILLSHFSPVAAAVVVVAFVAAAFVDVVAFVVEFVVFVVVVVYSIYSTEN